MKEVAPEETKSILQENVPAEETTQMERVQEDQLTSSDTVSDVINLNISPSETCEVAPETTDKISEVTEVSEVCVDKPETTETTKETIEISISPSENTTTVIQKTTEETTEMTEVSTIVTEETQPSDVVTETTEVAVTTTEDVSVEETTPEDTLEKTTLVEEMPEEQQSIEQTQSGATEIEITVEVPEVTETVTEKTTEVVVETTSTTVSKELPLFIAPLNDLVVMEKTTAKFEVTFEAAPESKVTWYLDGEELTPDDTLQIETTETHSMMLLKEVYPEDEGEYWVEVVDKAGKAKSTAYLQVTGMYV